MKKNKALNSLIEKLDYVDISINATHLNYVNSNSLLYTTDAAKNGGKSWIAPYKKPQLLYHDKQQDAVGRIISYSIENTASMKGEPNDFIKLNVRITDKEAISKVINGIYYTCSVGSSTSRVRCSICDQVLTVDGLCEHEKGTMVGGKKVYWIVDNITYKENSFVNNPADSYSRITSIDIGDGWMSYDKFLEDKETVLTKFFMEDSMQQTDAKLSTEARNKLSESAFCGPGRSFPAHDKAHVTAGLRLLNRSNFSESTKAKIKSCLYRKGKKYGIQPQEDELKEIPNLIDYRLSDDWTEEEIKQIADFFAENPGADSPTDEDFAQLNNEHNDSEYTIKDYDEVKTKEKEDIILFCDKLLSDYKEVKTEITTLKSEHTSLQDTEKTLNDKISEQNTILISKEDEIKKLMKDNAQLTVDYKNALIDSILDFKKYTGDRAEEFKKFESRKIDSLMDTLSDFRSESEINIPRVNDETLKDSTESDKKNISEKPLTDSKMSKIDRFFRKNILNTEE